MPWIGHRCHEPIRNDSGCDSAVAMRMEDVLLVAGQVANVTQGGAGTRSARACLPWAMVCNAVGVVGLSKAKRDGGSNALLRDHFSFSRVSVIQRGTVVTTVNSMLNCGDRSATMFACVTQEQTRLALQNMQSEPAICLINQ